MNTLVSVIIPVFNGEKYLGETLRAVEGQTYRPLEIVLINDGSTDASIEIIGDFQRHNSDSSLQIIVIEQQNQGISLARNKGIVSSTGDYLAFCDSDDLWELDKLTKQMELLRVSGSSACTVFMQPFWSPEIPHGRRHKIPTYAPTPFGASATVVKRSEFERVGFFEHGIYAAEWIEWMIRAREAKLDIVILSEVLAHRRIHESNNSRKGELERLEIIKAALSRKRAARSKENSEEGHSLAK